MINKTFTFQFNITLVEYLREIINDRLNVSFNIEHKLKLKDSSQYWAWNRICAIMDRLEDTLHYVNETGLVLNNHRSQFSFYEFINNAYVIIDCIKTIGKIFNIDIVKIKEIENSQDVFGNVLNANGNDSKFFKYIRSVCVVHPINTTHDHPYLLDSKLHCCAFVTHKNYWIFNSHNDCDLVAHIYTSKRDGTTIRIPLYIKQFENYLNKWVEFINEVIEAIENYCDNVNEEFKKQTLKSMESFASYVEYLYYLREEEERRFSNDMGYIYDKYIKIFNIRLSNEKNQIKLEKYKNAIRYAATFQYNAIQNMSFEGFQNTGIKFKDATYQIPLFDALEHCRSFEGDFSKYGYNLSKTRHLISDTVEDRIFARDLVYEKKEFLDRYIFYNGLESDEELYILVELALYLNSLMGKNLVNRNIPNTEKFREKILSEEELSELMKDEKIKK
ncbi:MAG: hypothetical protein NC182_05600 [Prevotella sp.]|nr:hypothetical protein [Staphylococcus sp.]MCM1350660.1 hypothetical protein [Prevotella sp.]